MKLGTFETRPQPAQAVQWDGTVEMAQEIISWIRTETSLKNTIEANLVLRAKEDMSVSILELDIVYPIQSSLRAGDWLVLELAHPGDTRRFFRAHNNEFFHLKFQTKENNA